jgi:hypothetical protein
MNRLIRKIRAALFPGVGKVDAVWIAVNKAYENYESRTPEPFHVESRLPDNCWIYNPPTEPCWYVFAPWNDGQTGMLRDSRVIVISRKTGEILYDGPAHDEG